MEREIKHTDKNKNTDEQIIRNQIASAMMEGITFTKDNVELIRKVVKGKLNINDVIAIIKEKYNESKIV